MPQPRSRRGTGAAVAVLAGTAVLAGCGGGGHHHGAVPSAPKTGQAAVIANAGPSAAGRAITAARGASGGLSGMSSGTDGSLYLSLRSQVVRVARKDVVSSVTPAASGSAVPHGVVVLPDGSFVTARNGQVVRIAAGKPDSAVAGVKGATRSLTAPTPSGAKATSTHFTSYVAPVGTLGDGSLVIADGDVLWRLLAGKLTVLYHHPAVEGPSGGRRPSVTARGAAVTPDGTVYLLPDAASPDTLAHVVRISAAGSAGRLATGGSAAGLPGAPGSLTPVWLSGDGASGLYVHATGARHGDYVLHVTGGRTTVVASATAAANGRCSAGGPTDAAKFPCALPRALVYQPGLVVLGGGEPYLVGVHLPAK